MDAPSFPSGSPSPPPTPFAAPGANHETERELGDVRYLLHVVMGAMVVLLITTSMGLYQQIRWLSVQAIQLNATAQELAKVVGDYETNAMPQMNRLFTELQRFSQTHPDFAKIMARYRVVAEAAATNAPVVRPIPADTPR